MKVKSSRKKIWSIPIAALAIVLMLAGALAVSGIVQAQSAGSKTILNATGITEGSGAAEIDAAKDFVYVLDTDTDALGLTTPIATVGDSGW